MKKRHWCLVVLLAPLFLLGQSAELRGTVRDSDGVGVPNADIELRNQESGERLKAQTSEEGEFRVVGIKAGVYQATVQAKGFRSLTRDDIRVKPQEQVLLNLILQTSIPMH